MLGGAAVMMFASILISGIELITKEPIVSREITIISVAIALGYGLGATTGATSHLPYNVQLIFGGSDIVPCSLCAILLNIILPKKSKNAPYMWDMAVSYTHLPCRKCCRNVMPKTAKRIN